MKPWAHVILFAKIKKKIQIYFSTLLLTRGNFVLQFKLFTDILSCIGILYIFNFLSMLSPAILNDNFWLKMQLKLEPK